MTTALSRAVFDVSFSRLRTALLAAASTSLLVGLSGSAQAASCATTAGADSCIITLFDVGDLQNGQADVDTIRFNDPVNPLSVSANQFGTGTPPIVPVTFFNFEAAEVVAGSILTITDTSLATTVHFTQSLTWTVTGVLSIGGTGLDAIGNSSAVTVNGNLDVNANETIGSLDGSGVVSLFGASVLTAGGSAATNLTYSGFLSGTGGFTKAGTRKLTLTANSGFTGNTTVSGGTLEIANAGAIDQSSSVTITSGELTGIANYTINAPLTITAGRLTGNAIINGYVTSNGGLQPGNTSIPPGGTVENPGQDMGSIRINGNYTATGTGAYTGMFINIDAAAPAGGTPGTTHDFLDINGDITGTIPTGFSVASFLAAPTGAATTGNGIQVIRVTGASSANDFKQNGALNAGEYQYLLKHVPDYVGGEGADGFFLHSAARDEIVAQAAILSSGQSMVRNCHRDDQRIPDSPKGATYGRAWVGYRQGSTDFGTDTGIDASADFSCTTGGMDWRMGHGWFGGVSGGFGSVTGDVQTPAGNGSIEGNSRAIEAFASFTSSALFVNLSGGYVDMDWIFNGALMPAIAAKTSGFLGSAQAGVALDLDPLAVKLIGGLSYDGTECSDACMGIATTQDTGLIEAKGTVRFDGVGMGGAIRPWAAVSLSDVISDGINTVSMGTQSISADTNSQLLSIDAGLQGYLDQNFALFIDGGYHQSLSVNVTGYKAGIGLKMYW